MSLLTKRRRQLLEQISSRKFAGREVVAFDDAGTAVPAEDRVVVAGRTDRFGPFEPFHRLLEKLIGIYAGFREGRFCTALVDDTGVIGAFVLALDLRQEILDSA